MNSQTEEPTPASTWQAVAGSQVPDEFLEWPADLFALTDVPSPYIKGTPTTRGCVSGMFEACSRRISTITLLLLAVAGQAFAQGNQALLRQDGPSEIREKDALSVKGFAVSAASQCVTSGGDGAFLKICITDHGNISSIEAQCFISGSDGTFLRICITDHGNIALIEAPAGRVHVFGREGYAVCSNNGLELVGFDAEIAEQGWEAPTVTQPNGLGKFPLIVTRKSTDGTLQLTQTFASSPGQRQLSVKMDVKNITATALPGLVIARYFDGDIDISAGDDIFELALDSVGGRNRHRVEAESFADWSPFGDGHRTDWVCLATEPGTPSPAPSDQVGRLVTRLDTINPGQATSSTFLYRIF